MIILEYSIYGPVNRTLSPRGNGQSITPYHLIGVFAGLADFQLAEPENLFTFRRATWLTLRTYEQPTSPLVPAAAD